MADKFPDFSKVDFEVVDADLTDEQEMQAAQEAEAALPGFRRRAGLIPGGKSLSGGSKHSPTVQTVVSDDLKAWLDGEAKAAGVSVSKYVRAALEERRRATLSGSTLALA